MHRILMLVNNDWKHDSRVMREAATLAGGGHEVHVISRKAVATPCTERGGEVTIHSVPLEAGRGPGRLAAAWASHFRVLRAASGTVDAPSVWKELGGLALRFASLLWLVPAILILTFVRGSMLLRRLMLSLMGTRGAVLREKPPFALIVRSAALAARMRDRVGRTLWPEYVTYLNVFGLQSVPLGTSLRPTVVHAHDLVTLAAGYAIATRCGSRLIYDAHELETHTNYWALENATQRWIASYEATLAARTDAIVTVCDSIADWLRDHYSVPRPVVVLNSPDLGASVGESPYKGGLRRFLDLPQDAPLAVYVGSVTRDRGLSQCVEASALIPGLHFALVGPRHIATEEEILALAARLGIRDRVHLVDPVPSQEVSGFVASADCSVIAIQNVCLSYYFCFPNKLLESVTSGVPVAVARLVELERFIGKYPVGVTMDEREPTEIANAIGEVLRQQQRYRPTPDMIQRIRNEYGWPVQQARLMDLYARLESAGQRPGATSLSGV